MLEKLKQVIGAFPGNDGPFSKTYKLILRKIKRHITLNQKFKAPTSSDRTWPTREII